IQPRALETNALSAKLICEPHKEFLSTYKSPLLILAAPENNHLTFHHLGHVASSLFLDLLRRGGRERPDETYAERKRAPAVKPTPDARAPNSPKGSREGTEKRRRPMTKTAPHDRRDDKGPRPDRPREWFDSGGCAGMVKLRAIR